jgi:hypothetical protein
MEFRNLELSDKIQFETIASTQPQNIYWENIFSCVFVWKEFYNTKIYFSDSYFIMFHKVSGVSFFTYCAKELTLNSKIENIISSYCKTNNIKDIIIKAISPSDVTYFSDNGYQAEVDRDDADYIYYVKDLSLLTGKKYHSKRNFVNRFQLNNSFSVLEYNPTLESKVLDYYRAWKELKSQEFTYLDEEPAVICSLKYYKELNLRIVLIINDKNQCLGFSCLSLDGNSPLTIFEKGDISYDGVYQYINNYCAIHYLNDYELLNRAEDLGLAGLRKAKLSYFPKDIALKYIVRKHTT